MAVHAQKLFFLHLGNQKPGQFDNDIPTLVGMDGVKEMVAVLWLLDRMGWQGHVEFDNHVLRTDTAPGKENTTRIRMDFIRQNVENYRMAEKKARELGADPDLAKLQAAPVGQGARHREAARPGRPAAILEAGGLREGQRDSAADRQARPARDPAAAGDVGERQRAVPPGSRHRG